MKSPLLALPLTALLLAAAPAALAEEDARASERPAGTVLGGDDVKPCLRTAVHVNDCWNDDQRPGPGHEPGSPTRSGEATLQGRILALARAVLATDLASAEPAPVGEQEIPPGEFLGGVPEAFHRRPGRPGAGLGTVSAPVISTDALRIHLDAEDGGRVTYVTRPGNGGTRTYEVPFSVEGGWDAALADPARVPLWIGSPRRAWGLRGRRAAGPEL